MCIFIQNDVKNWYTLCIPILDKYNLARFFFSSLHNSVAVLRGGQT